MTGGRESEVSGLEVADGEEAMVTDFYKLLDALAARAGSKPGKIRSKMFRHAYCAARLQRFRTGPRWSTASNRSQINWVRGWRPHGRRSQP